MDITKLDAIVDADAFDYVLTNPETGAPLMTLVLAGPTHPKMQEFKRKNERRLSAATKKSRDFTKALTNTITEVLDDEDVALDREMERLMLATLDWKGVEQNGQAMPYSAPTMEGLYRKKQWLRNAVKNELDRAENFIRSSASN